MKLQIIPLDESKPHQLYAHYQGQTNRQDAYIELDTRTGKMSADYDAEIGNAVPMSVWHGIVLRWTIPPYLASVANEEMERIAPLAQRVLDGASLEWDGNNTVGSYTADANAAVNEIEDLLAERADYNDEMEICWEAGHDWYYDAARQFLAADTTDEQIEAWMDEDSTPYDFTTAVIDRDAITEWMRGRRDELRAEAEDQADCDATVDEIVAEGEPDAKPADAKSLISLAAKAAADPFGPAMDDWQARAGEVTEETIADAYRLIGWEWEVATPGALAEAARIREDALRLLDEARRDNTETERGAEVMIMSIDYLLLEDDQGGEARLTNQSPSSSYGIPVLRITADDIDGDFGPADLIDYSSIGQGVLPAAHIVAAWAQQADRTPEELEAARLFLGQWPGGPQLDEARRG